LVTHVWQKLGGWCNLTTTTKYKYFNGLTPSAANRPAFSSAKRSEYLTYRKYKHKVFQIQNKFQIPNIKFKGGLVNET